MVTAPFVFAAGVAVGVLLALLVNAAAGLIDQVVDE